MPAVHTPTKLLPDVDIRRYLTSDAPIASFLNGQKRSGMYPA